MSFAKFLRTPFLKKHLQWQLLSNGWIEKVSSLALSKFVVHWNESKRVDNFDYQASIKIRAFCKSWVVSVQKLVFLATIAFRKAMETYNSSKIILNLLK